MKSLSFSDIATRRLTGEESFYDCAEIDPILEQYDARIAELEKALARLVRAVELFDNEDDQGVSKHDPAVTDAKALLGN